MLQLPGQGGSSRRCSQTAPSSANETGYCMQQGSAGANVGQGGSAGDCCSKPATGRRKPKGPRLCSMRQRKMRVGRHGMAALGQSPPAAPPPHTHTPKKIKINVLYVYYNNMYSKNVLKECTQRKGRQRTGSPTRQTACPAWREGRHSRGTQRRGVFRGQGRVGVARAHARVYSPAPGGSGGGHIGAGKCEEQRKLQQAVAAAAALASAGRQCGQRQACQKAVQTNAAACGPLSIRGRPSADQQPAQPAPAAHLAPEDGRHHKGHQRDLAAAKRGVSEGAF